MNLLRYMNCARKVSDYGQFVTLDENKVVTHWRQHKRMVHFGESFTVKKVRFSYKKELKAEKFSAGAYMLNKGVKVLPSTDGGKAVRKVSPGFVQFQEVVQHTATKQWWGQITPDEFINLSGNFVNIRW